MFKDDRIRFWFWCNYFGALYLIKQAQFLGCGPDDFWTASSTGANVQFVKPKRGSSYDFKMAEAQNGRLSSSLYGVKNMK